MKNFSRILLTFGLLFVLSTHALTLDHAETDEIFDQVNTDKDNTLEGDEVQTALNQVATKVFEKSKYYKDVGLINELAKEYAKDINKLTKEEFYKVSERLASDTKAFREKTYKDIIRKFEMNEILNDPELLEEVLRQPDVYGITFGSHKDVFEEIEKVYKETASTIQDIQKKFQSILDKGQQPIKVNHRNLQEVKEGAHKVEEKVQEVKHKVEEAVHAGVHRAQEGVKETVNTVKETVEKVQHKVEEAVSRGEAKAGKVEDRVKETIKDEGVAQQGADRAREKVEDIKNTATEGGHRVEEKVHEGVHTVQEGVQKTVNKVGETVEKVQHRVEEAVDKVEHRSGEAKDRTKENVAKTAENIKEKAQDTVDSVRETLHIPREKSFVEKLADAAGTIGDHIKDGINRVSDIIEGLKKNNNEPEGVKEKVQAAAHKVGDKIHEAKETLEEL